MSGDNDANDDRYLKLVRENEKRDGWPTKCVFKYVILSIVRLRVNSVLGSLFWSRSGFHVDMYGVVYNMY